MIRASPNLKAWRADYLQRAEAAVDGPAPWAQHPKPTFSFLEEGIYSCWKGFSRDAVFLDFVQRSLQSALPNNATH